MNAEEKTEVLKMDKGISAMSRIVKEHKVFWVTLPIELPSGEGRPIKVGMSLALVGMGTDNTMTGEAGGVQATYDKLYELARWLTSGVKHDVRFEIRRHDQVIFYLPEDLKTNRKNCVVVIRILHSDQFNQPLDKVQMQVLSEFEKKLKEIGSPKEHWKERPSII